MKLAKHISILYSLVLTACMIWSSKGEVVALNDESFEHQTQASTGMTTGSWLVLFKAQGCVHCNKLLPIFEKLSKDEEILERGFVLSTVDVMASPVTANRFIIRGFPTLRFLHKKQLFDYNGQRDYESLKSFLLGGFEKEVAKTIPPPPSTVEYYLKLFQAIGLELLDAAMGKSGATGYAIIALVGMLMAIFGFIISMFFMPAKKMKEN